MLSRSAFAAATVALVTLSSSAFGQVGKQAPRPPRFFPVPPTDVIFLPPPTMKIPPNESPVTIKKMSVKVAITGIEAETTTEITFHNPNTRVLEGNLEFPLQNDAAVTGYALDVNGQMIDGVIVAKEKARVVLETEMRRRVDPGLVEYVKGNVFRTRIYPIPASGDRTVRIVSVAPLTLVKNDAALEVPLPIGAKVPALELEVRVNHAPVAPQIGGFGNVTFTKWNQEFVAKTKMTDVTPDNDVFVNLPSLPAQTVNVEKLNDEHFIGVTTQIDAAVKDASAFPTKFTIDWDASGSRSPEAIKKDRGFLEALFKELKSAEVRLVVFRNRVESPEEFTVRDGKGADLFKRIDSLAYDGGTSLSELDFKKRDDKSGYHLVFTDGLATIGTNLPKVSDSTINVVSSDKVKDSGLQKFLADATGGLYLDLSVFEPTRAVGQLMHPQPALMRAESPEGALADVELSNLPAANRAVLYAKLNRDCDITLVFGLSGKEISRKTIKVKKSDANDGDILARSWAARRSVELGVFPDENATELLALGRKYQLVTPGTSLLVLERVDQYITHEILPPQSMPAWREQYLTAIKSRSDFKIGQERSHLNQVAELWKARVEWWEKKFPSDLEAIRKEVSVSRGGIFGGSLGGGSGAVSGRAAAAPPNAAMMESAGAMDMAADAAPAPEPMARSAAPNALKSKKGGGGSDASVGAAIEIKAWNPTTPYLKALEGKSAADAYSTYLEQKKSYATSPSFFFDCAGYFFKLDRGLAVRILTNLAEMKLEDPRLLRTLSWRLLEAGELDLAVDVLRKVKSLRPEDPQSSRDLGLALARRMERDKKAQDGIEASYLLNRVITEGAPRFPEIEIIAIMEMNHLLDHLAQIDRSALKKAATLDPRLRKSLDLDLRITMSWDADETDMDLHVVEPSEEEVFYSHRISASGGLVSHDITTGYGPEEYVIHRALKGPYKIKTNYFGSRQQSLLGPVTVIAEVITNWGRQDEKRQYLTHRLTESRETVEVGTVNFGGTNAPAQVSRLTEAQVGMLKVGMTPKEVIQSLGEPERRDGGALKVLLYRLNSGKQIQVGFGPNLLWVKEILDGAERKIIGQ